MSINYSSKQGFLTLELIMAIAIFLVFSLLLYIPAQGYLKRQYAMQLRLAAQEFAAELRGAQQLALYNSNITNRIRIADDKQGYIIEARNQLICFKDIGCDGVYFSEQAATSISYSNIGAPNKAGDYVLKHYKDASKSYTLTIQPSSGRVDIHEK